MKKLLLFVCLTLLVSVTYAQVDTTLQTVDVTKLNPSQTSTFKYWLRKMFTVTAHNDSALHSIISNKSGGGSTTIDSARIVQTKYRTRLDTVNTQTRFNAKANLVNPTFTGTVKIGADTAAKLSDLRGGTIIASTIDTTKEITPTLYGGGLNGVSKCFRLASLLGKTAVLSDSTYVEGGGTTYLTGDLKIRVQGKGKLQGTIGQWFFNSVPSVKDTLKEAISVGDSFITLKNLASKTKRGDIIKLYCPTIDWGFITGTTYSLGELLRVRQVGHDTVFFEKPIENAYAVNTTDVYNLNAYKVDIEGVHFAGVEVTVTYCKDVRVNRCELYPDYPWTGLTVKECIGGEITYNILTRNIPTIATHVYGISVYSCYDINANFNIASNFNQSLIAGGNYPCVNIKFNDNVISSYNTTAAQIDGHPNTVGFEACRNRIVCSGIGILSNSTGATITGNWIYPVEGGGGIYYERSASNVVSTGLYHKNPYVNISYNHILRLPGVSTGTGIQFILGGTLHDSTETVTMEGNVIDVNGYGILFGQNGSRTFIKKCLLAKNNIKTHGGGYPAIFQNSDSLDIWDAEVINNTLETRASVTIDWVRGAGKNSARNLKVLSNNIYNHGYTYACRIGSVNNALFDGNHIFAGSDAGVASGGQLFANNLGYLVSSDNIWHKGSAMYYFDTGIGESVIYHDVWDSCTLVLENSLFDRYTRIIGERFNRQIALTVPVGTDTTIEKAHYMDYRIPVTKSFTINAGTTPTPTYGDEFTIVLSSNGTSYTVTWGTGFTAEPLVTGTASKRFSATFRWEYNSDTYIIKSKNY